MKKNNKLSEKDLQSLLTVLKTRFEKHKNRHKGIQWTDVEERLLKKKDKMWSLQAMEESGGEPDVFYLDKKSGEIVFADFSAESPKDRRSLCFDKKAHEDRKEFKPAGDASSMAEEMGIEMLSEEDYRKLQEMGEFDLKTSSWIATPAPIRKLGGALFADRRYDHVFVYHNGASSYYAARGFRGKVSI